MIFCKQFHLVLLGVSFVASVTAQTENLPKTSAGFPINYREDSVGEYVLPDPLLMLNGKRVITTEDWMNKRRPEIFKMMESVQFGKTPPAPVQLQYVLREQGKAMQGKAWRKQVRIYLNEDTAGHYMDVLVYLPVSGNKPFPLLTHISFTPNNLTVDDPGIFTGYVWTRDGKKQLANQPSRFPRMNVEQFIDAGMGFATIYYGDIEPDFKTGYLQGIRGKYLTAGQHYPANDEWGAIAAWSWGLSRTMDYFEIDHEIDQHRIALQGASRLGKTVLWTGARDTRFKVIIASISGEGGAALSKRNYGENLLHITDTSRYYYQFAPNYHQYAFRTNELPFDAHLLVALIAPRPLLLQTGDSDYWSDPHGEYLSALAAAPVYQLFGQTTPTAAQWPGAGDTSQLMHTLGYYMHNGGHTVLSEDWGLFVTYLRQYL